MSEQINKVLADRPQNFSTSEQAQARANIGAVWTGDMSGYVSYSAIAGDTANSAITSINGSSIGGTQVVTATAGVSSYVTSINGSALSGIAPLDEATVSSIASSYAESAASGKLDNSASGTWYPMTGNPSGFINRSEQVVTATAGTSSYVTSINGSAISGVGSLDKAPIKVVYGTGFSTSVTSSGDDLILNVDLSAHMGALGTHGKWSMAPVWTATAVDQVLPYANYIGSPYGYDPYYVHWWGVLEAPYAARFDLIESATLKDGSPLGEYLLDSCYVPAGNSSFVRLAGISYGYGNNMYMNQVYVKVHWDENPLSATLNIHTQSGYYLALCMGTTIGPILTFPVQ